MRMFAVPVGTVGEWAGRMVDSGGCLLISDRPKISVLGGGERGGLLVSLPAPGSFLQQSEQTCQHLEVFRVILPFRDNAGQWAIKLCFFV